MRRTGLLAALALSSLLVPGCSRFSSAVGLGQSASGPDPATAIALSVPGESIALVDPTSGNFVPIASVLTDFQSGYASWAPGHKALAYGNAGIIILNPVTQKGRWMLRGQSISMPAWSPDAKQIAYGNATAMWTSATAGKARPDRIFAHQGVAPFGMDWSSTGVIAFEGLRLNCDYAEGCFSTNRSDIWLIRPNGSGLRQITRVGRATAPKWSPDGSQFLLVRSEARRKGATSSQLWVANANGGGMHRLTSAGNVLAADWSPTGAKIAIVRQGTVTNTLEVWIANADGTGLHPIATGIPGADATVDW